MDLNDVSARTAKEYGVKLVINTDSHDTGELAFMNLGVGIARRARLTEEDVINTWSRERLTDFLGEKKARFSNRCL